MEIIERKFERTCSCGKIFRITKPYQLFCCENCEKLDSLKLKEIEEKRLNKNCELCGVKFRRVKERSHQKFCDQCKRQDRKIYNESRKNTPTEPKEKRKGLSLQELIRRSEYKRIMDDSGWDWYLSGKKYDKI